MPSDSTDATIQSRPLDRQIHQIITARLKPDDGSKISVIVRGGFVTLKGRAQTYREKERMHRFVMGLEGVRALKDLIRVQPAESIADRNIAMHIRNALDAHSELPLGTAVVRVRKGIATLNGYVRTAEERFMAENVASHCRGVTQVVNSLTVDPLDEISDEAATRAVRCALAYCEEFETQGITISCADGVIVLRGEVPSILDRTLAEELARMQCGVRSVENDIQVQGAGKRKKSALPKSSKVKVKQNA